MELSQEARGLELPILSNQNPNIQTSSKLTEKDPKSLLVILAGAVLSLEQRSVPALTFLPNRKGDILNLTVLPDAFRPAALPILEPPPAGRLPAEPVTASFRARPAGSFRVLCAVPARASAYVIGEPRRSSDLVDERVGRTAFLRGLPLGST